MWITHKESPLFWTLDVGFDPTNLSCKNENKKQEYLVFQQNKFFESIQNHIYFLHEIFISATLHPTSLQGIILPQAFRWFYLPEFIVFLLLDLVKRNTNYEPKRRPPAK